MREAFAPCQLFLGPPDVPDDFDFVDQGSVGRRV
jgi:hypothetical protein